MNFPKAGLSYVGIDNGSNQIKLYTQINGRVVTRQIPSHVGFGLANLRSSEKDDDDKTTMATKGGDGKLGLYHVNAAVPLETTNADYQYNEVNRILVNRALFEANLGGPDKTLHLCVGLPIMAYYHTHDFSWREDNIAKVVQNLSTPVYHYADTTPEGEVKLSASPVANIKKVDVMAETVAAWMDDRMVVNEQGNIVVNKAISKESRIYIDIGGNTTDVLIVGDSKIDAASDSLQIGGNHLFDHIGRMISSRTGIPRNRVTHAQIEQALKTNAVRTAHGSRIDLESDIEAIKNEFFSNLRHSIKGLIGYKGSEVERVVLLGGTAKEHYSQLQLFDEDLQKLHDEPVFANARAMWKRAKMLHLAEQRQSSQGSARSS